MSGLMRLVVNNYNEILQTNKEIMVDSWPMMGSPGPMLCIVGTYLAFVLKVGPKMMEKRPAFQLNFLLIAYNAFQVLFSIWLTLQSLEPGVGPLIFSPKCNSANRTPIDINVQTSVSKAAWWYFVAKLIELLDTVSVLRTPQEAKSGDLLARLPSHDDLGVLLVLSQVSTWGTGCSDRFPQFFRTHCHVLVLPDRSSGPSVQKIPMVEEIHDRDSTGTIRHNVRLPDDGPRDGLQSTESTYILLPCERGDLHLPIPRLLQKSLQEEEILISSNGKHSSNTSHPLLKSSEPVQKDEQAKIKEGSLV